MCASVRWSMFAILALTPATTAAQISSGLVFERGDPAHRVGVQLGGTLGVDLTSRLALQFEGAYVAFGKTPDHTYALPCPAPGCAPVRTTGTRLALWSGTVNLRLMEQRDRNALFWTAGVGGYLISNDASRFGWNVGGGVRLSRSILLDVRYHQLVGAASTRSLIPISFGIRF
jgi:hypothetical protein